MANPTSQCSKEAVEISKHRIFMFLHPMRGRYSSIGDKGIF
jgi:hypothetical protein